MKLCKECKDMEEEFDGALKVTVCNTRHGKHHSKNDKPSWVGVLNEEIEFRFWHKKGELHRENAPAVECNEDNYIWHENNVPHRAGGEQCLEWFGDQGWAEQGQWHCEHGPAYIESDGTKHWYLRGQKMTEEEWNKKKKKTSRIRNVPAVIVLASTAMKALIRVALK